MTLKKAAPYLKSYEQGNPQNFVSNFGEVKKDLCQTCHNQQHGAPRLSAVPQISCERRDHANHEHENPNSIALDAIAMKQANGEPRVRLLWVISGHW